MTARTVLLAGFTAALVTAAPAQAATLTTDKACYQERETVRVVGTGFTPGAPVDMSRDNLAFGTLVADATGTIRGGAPAPLISPARQRSFAFAGTDRTNPAITATVARLATIFDVDVVPLRGSPARTRRITARGFTTGRTLYVHVRRKGRGRNIRLGRLKGACGTKKVRKRIFSRRARSGTYTVQFDTRRRYSRRTFPRIVYAVTIFRVFRPRRSAAAAFATGERWVRVR